MPRRNRSRRNGGDEEVQSVASSSRLSLNHSYLLDRASMRRESHNYASSLDQSDLLDPKTRIGLEWSGIKVRKAPRSKLKFWGKTGEQEDVLLHGVSGKVDPGEMLLVLGPSGSGKSLLLAALASRTTPGLLYTGQVKVNGKPRSPEFLHTVAYVDATVTQLDSMMTVRESLQFTSTLLLPSKYSEAEKEERIRFVMAKLGLGDAADRRIGLISQGEKKRTCIAQQLLREPKVLILDEPTTGLDSTSAKTLVSQLRALAVTDAITMIMSLHQPRAITFDQFDSLILLAQGKQVYFGSAWHASLYFRRLGFACPKHANPSEFFISLVSNEASGDDGFDDGTTADDEKEAEELGKRINTLVEAWEQKSSRRARNAGITGESSRKSVLMKSAQKPYEFQYNAGRWTEFITLFSREWSHFHRSGHLFWLIILGNILIGAFIGFIWFQIPDDGFQAVQNRIGLLSFIPRDRLVAIAMLVMVARTKGRVLAERRISMYRSSSYYLAIMAFYCCIEVGIETIFALVIYSIAGLRFVPFTALLIYLGLHALLLTFTYSLGIIIPFFTPSPAAAFITGMVIWSLIPLYNGLFVNLSEVSWILRWPCFISPQFYYFIGAVQNEMDGLTLNGEPGEYWLGLYALDTVSVMWCAGALLIMNFVGSLGSYLTLKYRTRPKFCC